jgi:hypothetical protein
MQLSLHAVQTLDRMMTDTVETEKFGVSQEGSGTHTCGYAWSCPSVTVESDGGGTFPQFFSM